MSYVTEIEAVKAVIQNYSDGTYNRDLALLKSAFHPEAIMTGFRGDDLLLGSPAPFFDRIESEPAFKESGVDFRSEITSIVVNNCVASVTLEESGYFGMDITDYFQLVKVDGAWKILSKLFQVNTWFRWGRV